MTTKAPTTIAPLQTTTTSSAPLPVGCVYNKLTNTDRALIVDAHNNHRSKLALGQEPNNPSGYAAPAANMYKFVSEICCLAIVKIFNFILENVIQIP